MRWFRWVLAPVVAVTPSPAAVAIATSTASPVAASPTAEPDLAATPTPEPALTPTVVTAARNPWILLPQPEPGANGIVAMRFDTSEVGQSLTEIVAYGTAVKVEPV